VGCPLQRYNLSLWSQGAGGLGQTSVPTGHNEAEQEAGNKAHSLFIPASRAAKTRHGRGEVCHKNHKNAIRDVFAPFRPRWPSPSSLRELASEFERN